MKTNLMVAAIAAVGMTFVSCSMRHTKRHGRILFLHAPLHRDVPE